MISWTVATTGPMTTNFFSSQTIQTGSTNRTENSSTSGLAQGGSSTYSFTRQESESKLTSLATISSANETATFGTSLTSLASAYYSLAGETINFEFPDPEDNYSIADGGTPNTGTGLGTQTYPQISTASGLRTYLSVNQDTSTTITSAATEFVELSSGTNSPLDFDGPVRQSSMPVTTLIEEGGATIRTTTQSPATYWWASTRSTEETVDTTTSQTVTTTGPYRATIYQAEGNEVIYKLTAPTSYASTPQAARPLAETATRITVLPLRQTIARGSFASSISLTAQGSPSINLSAATAEKTIAGTTETTRNLTQYGPDSESSELEYAYTVPTFETTTSALNYTYTQAFSAPDEITTESTLSRTAQLYDETQLAVEGNTFADASWLAELFVDQPPQTAQSRFGKSMWNINGQKGSQLTPPTFPYQLSYFTASCARGQVTLLDASDADVTLSMPTAFYKTTVGETPTTASVLLGAVGQPQRIADDVGGAAHLGGGVFAESWTVIDRVQPDYLYSDLKNDISVSHLGNDTSYSQGQIVAASHLTFEPFLLGGGFVNDPTPNAIVWSEHRNPPAAPA